MTNRKITITLTGAVKLDGEDRKAGDQVEVTAGVALQLVELGVLAALPDIEVEPAAPGEDPVLHEKARAMAETMVGQAVAQATAEALAERDNERRRADEVALQLAAVTTERDALKAQLAGESAQPAVTEAVTLPDGGGVTAEAPKKRSR